jgi:hypothetical protein
VKRISFLENALWKWMDVAQSEEALTSVMKWKILAPVKVSLTPVMKLM